MAKPRNVRDLEGRVSGKKGSGRVRTEIQGARARREVSNPPVPALVDGGEARLRPLRREDYRVYRQALDAPEFRAWMPEDLAGLDERAPREFEALLAQPSAEGVAFAILPPDGDEAVGEIHLDSIDADDGSAEVMTYVTPTAQGAGLSRGAMRAVLRYAFKDRGLRSVALRYLGPEPRWVKGAGRLGFIEQERHPTREGSRDEVVWLEVTAERFFAVDRG